MQDDNLVQNLTGEISETMVIATPISFMIFRMINLSYPGQALKDRLNKLTII
jgi:hypothetical protein